MDLREDGHTSVGMDTLLRGQTDHRRDRQTSAGLATPPRGQTHCRGDTGAPGHVYSAPRGRRSPQTEPGPEDQSFSARAASCGSRINSRGTGGRKCRVLTGTDSWLASRGWGLRLAGHPRVPAACGIPPVVKSLPWAAAGETEARRASVRSRLREIGPTDSDRATAHYVQPPPCSSRRKPVSGSGGGAASRSYWPTAQGTGRRPGEAAGPRPHSPSVPQAACPGPRPHLPCTACSSLAPTLTQDRAFRCPYPSRFSCFPGDTPAPAGFCPEHPHLVSGIGQTAVAAGAPKIKSTGQCPVGGKALGSTANPACSIGDGCSNPSRQVAGPRGPSGWGGKPLGETKPLGKFWPHSSRPAGRWGDGTVLGQNSDAPPAPSFARYLSGEHSSSGQRLLGLWGDPRGRPPARLPPAASGRFPATAPGARYASD